MKAHDSYLTDLLKLSDAMFNIPVYQRNYTWNENHCKQLFTDMESITFTQKDHFIGSIVYISIGTATEPYYNIIDGQQRITSVMLFLRALYDSSSDARFRARIRNGFLINAGIDDEPKVKLKQVESDSVVYEKIMLQNNFDESAFTDAEKDSNVYKNYCFFKQAISESESTLDSLYHSIFNLEIIDVRLTTEDPQEVFESMNSTGKDLTNTDLLRNYLLMALTDNDQTRLYKKYWAQIEKNVGPKLMEQYMVHYLILKRKSDSITLNRRSSKVNKNTLYDCYKVYFPADKKTVEATEELLMDMYKYSVFYRRIVRTDNPKTSLEKLIHELIVDLNAEPVAIFLMYLLYVQSLENTSEKEIIEAVKACISYVFRVRIFKGSVSNQFFALAIQYFERDETSENFVDRVWNALTSGQGSYRFPKNREFQHELENKDLCLEFKPQMIRYILYKFENSRTKELVEPSGVTIEHILPQDPKEWQQHLLDIGDSNFRDFIHKIGNLTLTKLNSEASNDPFSKKKKIYENSGYTITREIAKCKDWNSVEIKRRGAALAAEAVELWPLPAKYNQDVSASTWQIMDDQTEELFDQLCDSIKEYDPSIYEDPKKQCVNFVRNKKTVLSVIPRQSYITVVLNEKKENLSPNANLEDISMKGHWGTGDCRMNVSSDDDIWFVLNYVEQIVGAKSSKTNV